MRRLLANLLAAASLLLMAAVAALWVRSYWVADAWQRAAQYEVEAEQRRDVWMVDSRRGVVAVQFHRQTIRDRRDFYEQDIPGGWWYYRRGYFPLDLFWNAAGFGVFSASQGSARSSMVSEGRGVAVPHAALAVALAAPPAWWAMRYRRRRRARLAVAAGRCAACGYDLTGNQSGRCPECGTPARAV